jgi:hypothetical protein
MPSLKLTLPYFPQAPAAYDKRYLDSVVQNFSLYLQQQNNPGDSVLSTLRLLELPASAENLVEGEIFRDNSGRLFMKGDGLNPNVLYTQTVNTTDLNSTTIETNSVTSEIAVVGPWRIESENGSLTFTVNGQEKMRLDQNGNLSVAGNLTANAVL